RSSNLSANSHCATEVGVRINKDRFRTGTKSVEKSADEAEERGAKSDVTYLDIGEAHGPEAGYVLLVYPRCILCDGLGKSQHFDISRVQSRRGESPLTCRDR